MTENRDLESVSEIIIRPWWYRGLIVKEAKGSILIDLNGRSYIDTTSSFFVSNIGHCHPEVVDVIKAQVEKTLSIPQFQLTIPAIKLAAKITKMAPVKGATKRLFYTVAGAETIETGIRFARCFTGKQGIIALQGGFHGWTYGAVSATGLKAFRTGAGPVISGVYHAMAPYCYRCALRLKYPDCGLMCARDIEKMLIAETEDFAAVLLEPILGAGGGIIPPDGYLKEVRNICDRYGVLLIADEIQTGFGRSGKMFAVDHWDVEPDILCVSKSCGGGLALGAVVARQEIAEKFTIPTPSTFAGHPVACAAGLKTIEIIERDKLWENAAKIGDLFLKMFGELAEKYPTIGEVRFRGLMGGVELVKDRKTKEPAKEESKKIVNQLREEGVIAIAGGLSGSTFRIQPPLIIAEEQAIMVVEAFDKTLKSLGGKF